MTSPRPPLRIAGNDAPRRAQALRPGLLAALAAVLTTTGGCGSQTSRAGIQSADAGDRILAIRAAGEHRDRQAVPLLVDRLDDEDEAVRFYAILALERITGTRFGYDYRVRGAALQAAIDRWQDYVRRGGVREAGAVTDGSSSAVAAGDKGPS